MELDNEHIDLEVQERACEQNRVEVLSEKKEVARIGARAQRNSGRGILEKGDAVHEPFLIDIKEYAESFSVSRKVWAKISTDAFAAQQRVPALALVLGDKTKLRLWVVSDEMFEEMREAWLEKYDREGL